MIIGAILQTAAVDYAMMLVARVITGLGNGLLTSTVPAYQSECAKPHRRGQLVLFEGSLITFGIMISYWVNVGFFFATGSISWRFPIAIQILFALVMIVRRSHNSSLSADIDPDRCACTHSDYPNPLDG